MSVNMIANMCTSIRNAVAVGKRFVEVPHSKFKEQILSVMKSERFIRDYQVVSLDETKKIIKINLLYGAGNHPAINEIKAVSKSGCRVYCKGAELKPIKRGVGISILSTNHGVMSDSQLRKLKENGVRKLVGGEVICSLW